MDAANAAAAAPAPAAAAAVPAAAAAAPAEARDPDVVIRQVLEKIRANADRSGIRLPGPEAAAEAAAAAPADAADAAGAAAANGDGAAADERRKSLSGPQRDALQVLSALCAATQQESQSAAEQDARLRASLELLRDLLQQCGPVLKTCEAIVEVVREQLCPSLLKHCMSNPSVFVLSLQILVVFIKGFRESLKGEIGIFLDQIVLRILDSGGSTYQHKYRVLQVLYKICADTPAALEIFLNFDCDEQETNLFERIVDCLAKIAQGKYAGSDHTTLIQPHQEQELQTLAFKSMVKLVGSLVEWSKQMSQQEAPGDNNARTPGRAGAEDTATDADDDAQSDSTRHTTGSGAAAQLNVMQRRNRKRELQIGVQKFNLKPKKGIEHLRRTGFVSDEPEALAEFLRRPDVGLDKTTIGDFLGELKPFNVSVMNHLVDGLGFAGLELDAALRSFLSVFRLPGEAQKVERLMEKFAEKYCTDNPTKFSNSDCAFILSFAIIMLQTDLHNPQVKNKMTKDQFISNNRGIDDGKDLPKAYLEQIYDSVVSTPFSLKEDDEMKAKLECRQARGAAQKVEIFARETQNIMKVSQELMDKRAAKPGGSTTYVVATSTKYVGPFFEAICWPMLATLSVLLEMNDEQGSVDLCMEGFTHCIRIAARFDMETERDAIVSSLAKFTYLTTIKEMRQKNIDCVKALLVLGSSEGNFLGPSWQYVLFCISQLERLHLLKSRAREDFQCFAEGDGLPRNNSGSNPGAAAQGVKKRRAYGTGIAAFIPVGMEEQQVELVNSECVMAQIDAAQIDRLFNRSTNLSSAAIVHFVTQLTRVSREELQSVDQPRIFALQKLVEVGDYNMNRIPLVWSRIWHVLSHHFVEASTHANSHVGMYAMDSMRQLALKFLERDDMNDFQGEFLSPFESVMNKSSVSRDVKELVISSVAYFVHHCFKHIRSGWRVVFRVVRLAAKEHDEAVPERAAAVLEMVLSDHFKIFADNFVDGVCALSALGQCKAKPSISMRAIERLAQAAEHLAATTGAAAASAVAAGAAGGATPVASAGGNGAQSGPETGAERVAEALAKDEEEDPRRVADWLLVMQGLAALVGDPRPEIRVSALGVVYECLATHGTATFDEDMWRTVLKGVIKPLFDEIHMQLSNGDTCLVPVLCGKVLNHFREMPPERFGRFLPELFPMLSELISVDDRTIRGSIQDIFMNQVAPVVAAEQQRRRRQAQPLASSLGGTGGDAGESGQSAPSPAGTSGGTAASSAATR